MVCFDSRYLSAVCASLLADPGSVMGLLSFAGIAGAGDLSPTLWGQLFPSGTARSVLCVLTGGCLQQSKRKGSGFDPLSTAGAPPPLFRVSELLTCNENWTRRLPHVVGGGVGQANARLSVAEVKPL